VSAAEGRWRPRDWDAGAYDTISDMQLEWGREVLARIDLRGDERVLDAGCGTGKVTELIAERVPRGRAIGVDASPSMIEAARARLGEGVDLIVADLLDLHLDQPVDVVFSNATFHWVPDHDRLYRRLRAALRPGGRLQVQYGGKGNVAALEAAVSEAATAPPFAEHLAELVRPWRFASADEALATVKGAGFAQVRCWLERKTERFEQPWDLYACGLGDYLDRLPESLRERFVTAVMDRMPDPTLREYVRLNVSARRPE
jgi:trans-aconitate 2-methyltransferase